MDVYASTISKDVSKGFMREMLRRNYHLDLVMTYVMRKSGKHTKLRLDSGIIVFSRLNFLVVVGKKETAYKN